MSCAALRRAASTAALLVWVASGLAAPAAQASSRAESRSELVLLKQSKLAHANPAPGSRTVAHINARRPIAGARTALPVIGKSTDNLARQWLRVRLPGRRLGQKRPPRSGWILAANTSRAGSAWRLVVLLDRRRVLVYHRGRVVRRFAAVVGAPGTPTPRGEFFVEENLRLRPGHSGAPFALALSARSRVLQSFAGGPGQIALHGRRNVGGVLGTAVSHGCVRLEDRSISWLAARIRPGVPVSIR